MKAWIGVVEAVRGVSQRLETSRLEAVLQMAALWVWRVVSWNIPLAGALVTVWATVYHGVWWLLLSPLALPVAYLVVVVDRRVGTEQARLRAHARHWREYPTKPPRSNRRRRVLPPGWQEVDGGRP